jgi:hypothetical protein
MAYVQDEQPALLDTRRVPGFGWRTTWRMRWLRLRSNPEQVTATAFGAALGGGIGALVGGYLGAWGLDLRLSLAWYACFLGITTGGSVGAGYGLTGVMDKHLRPWGYATSAAIVGGIVSLLAAVLSGSRTFSERMLEIAVGLAFGGLGGLLVALIVRVTQLRMENRARRLVIRLALSLVVGVLAGLLFAWENAIGLFPPNADYAAYGMLVGLLTMPGITFGLGRRTRP